MGALMGKPARTSIDKQLQDQVPAACSSRARGGKSCGSMMSPCWAGRWCCDVSRSASSMPARKAATPMPTSSSAATAAMTPTWITGISHRTFSGSGGRTGFRQASRHTGGTTGSDMGSGQFPRPAARGSEQDSPMARRDSARTPAAAAGAASRRLADELARRGGPGRQRAARGLRELGAVDRARDGGPGGPAFRSAGNGGHRRNVRAGEPGGEVRLVPAAAGPAPAVPVWRNVAMPASTSFPSGHAASGFAFAAAIGRDQPWLGLALRFLAAAVAYSRVHTGVHYPGDAVAGALIGEGIGQAVAGLMDRPPPARRPSRSGPRKQRELPDGADAEGAMIPMPATETG